MVRVVPNLHFVRDCAAAVDLRPEYVSEYGSCLDAPIVVPAGSMVRRDYVVGLHDRVSVTPTFLMRDE